MNASSTLLLLVDGHHLVYRSFYALPTSLAAPDGTPTGALLGFARALNALRVTWRPTHLATVFDGGIPQFRCAVLPQYKAQRPPMPEPLRRQMPLLSEYLKLSGVPVLLLEGQESDDVLATLADRAARDGANVLISSGDKDLLQMVSAQIRIVRPESLETALGSDDVMRMLGVPPARVPELLALAGDAVDNVPGVRGVGPKTAQKLLSVIPSLNELWERLDQLSPPHLRENLREARSAVERNLEILRLRRDIPGLPHWSELTVGPMRAEQLRAFLYRLGLRSLYPRSEQMELL